MWSQTADIGREFEGQHGDGAVGEIDAGAAQARFLIERGIRRHILSHVGDVDLQLEVTVGEITHGDGVVEIARGFSVDGDDGKGAEVAAVAKFLRRNNSGDVLRLFESRRGKVVRQVKLADGDFDIDAEVVLEAEDFDDASAGILRGRGPVGDFDVNYHAFKIVPCGAVSGFLAENAVRGFSM